ncbi:photosynthetic reaction center subunit H [Nitratireductor alexandrii]|uniref:photosynthetic reaction center subunit H n=1 Tax=Nitratireductor alexandrii TaxID=2448161 RepID=UPI000FD77A96|nr:photosynthetic reaction center subunit H [Nitratireductor alexandrii]
MTGSVVGSIDVAQVVLYAFWVFFAGLIWYIRKEDRREGYPLEDDVSGAHNKSPWLFVPDKKTFVLPHGQGTKQVPDLARDERALNAERMARASGSPLEPTGNPMLAGVGPGSWAERQDLPDLTAHGEARIVPMRVADGFDIAAGETDPRGLPVVGCDRKPAGIVKDVWVDRSEHLIRYYEIEGEDGASGPLLPNNFVVIKKARGDKPYLYVHAVTSEQFADVPGHAKAETVTRLEEDKIAAYYGGGLLYALRNRREALL